MLPGLFTIGHSTHSLKEFIALLTRPRVELLVDVPRFPGSRKYPHFNRENLESALPAAGISYLWLESLGGRRPKTSQGPSKNVGLRNESFRNYADYMATDEFRAGVTQLLEHASQRRTAFMCSESVFWRCHRRLISDYLQLHGIAAQHIMPSGDLHPHALTAGAQLHNGEVIYSSPPTDQRNLFPE